MTSCLVSFTENTYENGSTLKEKNSLQRRVDTFLEKRQYSFDQSCLPLKLYTSPLKTFYAPAIQRMVERAYSVLYICLHFKDVSLYASEMDEI